MGKFKKDELLFELFRKEILKSAKKRKPSLEKVKECRLINSLKSESKKEIPRRCASLGMTA